MKSSLYKQRKNTKGISQLEKNVFKGQMEQ